MNEINLASLCKINRSQFMSLKKQAGMSGPAWLVVLAVIAFLALFAFKVVPMYFENRMVVESLKQLDEPGHPMVDMSDAELRKRLLVSYEHNNINGKGPQNIIFDRKSGGLIIKVDYEARENLFANIDVVVSFKNHLDAERPALCCTPVEEVKSAPKY